MNADLQRLPVLRNDQLLFQDTVSIPVPGSIVRCLLCVKPFIMRPYSGSPDQTCPECWNTYKDCAKVICIKCQPPVTICRLKPRVLDNGYYIRPRSILHSSSCNVCNPGLTHSIIVEIDTWMNSMRRGKLIIPFGKNS